MKKYCETRGQEKFNWYDFLLKDEYTIKELIVANYRAQSWVTCACGNMCTTIERDSNGMPIDNMLKGLGANFGAFIHSMACCYKRDNAAFEFNRRNALITLECIDERTKILLEAQRHYAKCDVLIPPERQIIVTHASQKLPQLT